MAAAAHIYDNQTNIQNTPPRKHVHTHGISNIGHISFKVRYILWQYGTKIEVVNLTEVENINRKNGQWQMLEITCR